MPLVLTKESPTITATEWQARVDLAAAHRLAVWHGFSEGIFNHLTLSVPGKSDRYYQIPFGLHWSEVTASCFMEVDWDGRVLAGEGEVEQSAYCIHAPIHRLVPVHACVLHTHMPYASALSRLEQQEILPIGQTEIGLMDKIAYDDTYTGPALDPGEGERLAGILGPDKKILFMANHGVAVCGESVAEAYDLLYYLERAAQVQLYAMWTGRKLREVKPEIVSYTQQQYEAVWPKYGNKSTWNHHFDALKRLLDRKEPDYAD
jgi:ribulose-5-phosphate 4-epimerase/fuculose-1-phosphate aldolase